MKRLRLGLAFNLAEPFNSGRALDPAAASIIRGTLASDHELPRELVRILIGSRTLRAHSPAVIRVLARACIDAIPDFIRIALCPETFGTTNESNESNEPNGHRLVHDNTVSVLMSVPGSHRTAVVAAAIDALARPPSQVSPVGPANAAKRILSLVLAAWPDPSDAEREQIISLVCTAAVRDSNTAPLKALVVSAQGTDFESIAKAIIRTCALADPMDSEDSTDSRAWGPGLAATIDVLVAMPFSQHLFGPFGHGSGLTGLTGASAPVGSTIIHIARATVGDDVPARAAYDILRAIVQREPVRSISQSALIPFLITQEQTGPFGPGAVLEGVLKLAHIDEAEMDRCIKAAKGAVSGPLVSGAVSGGASGLRALRLLARANEGAFISIAKSRCLLHDLVRGGCDLGAFFAPTEGPQAPAAPVATSCFLAPLGLPLVGLPLVGLIEGTDRDGKLLIETALAAGNEPSVIFLTRAGLTGLTGLSDADRRSGLAVIEALRTYSPFANKCPFDSTASGRVMRVKRAHSVSVDTAKCFIDLIGTAMRATPPDIRSPPVAIMVGLGLAKYLVYVAVHGAVGTDGTAGTDGTDGTDGTNGPNDEAKEAKEAIDTLKYASAQCGLSLTELIVTGSLVLRAVENKLDSFASDLVALLAAERETHRVVSVALFSDAPLPLLAMVHRNVREEFAERIASVRSLVSRLASITADAGISADQDLYRPVASLVDRAGARVAELERKATLEEIIRQYAVRVVQISSSTTSDTDDVRAAVDRLVFLLELNGDPEASIARLYSPSAPSAPSAPLAPHFCTAFAHPSIWPHVVGTVKTEDLLVAWMQHATRVFDLHESDISRYAKWTGGVIPREALMDQSRARGALLRIAEFVEACGFPHAEACRGILGSEIVIPTSTMAMDTDGPVGQSGQSDQSATEVGTPVVLGGTGMGHGAQRYFLHAVLRSLTGLKKPGSSELGSELALFHLYPTGLVPQATADEGNEILLRLFGWVTGSMFVSDTATGYPCIAPAVLALIMGIRVPSLVYALNPELRFTHEADIDIALSCVGPTTEHFTESQIAEITEQFTARTGLSHVTPDTFEHFVAVVEPHFALALSKSIEPIATGFRAAIVGSDAPADVELNAMAALAAIFGTQASDNGASGANGARLREEGHYWHLFATPENLSTIGSVAAGQCTLTIDYIRRNTTYDGALMSHHPGVRVFWSALARLSPEELAEFFFLWTSMHPPRAGHTGGSFKITGVRWDSTFRLPIVTHTCFGSIEVRIDSLASEDSAFEAITRTLAEGRLLKSVDD